MKTQDSLSVVVPLFNEQDNVHLLIRKIHDALEPLTIPWELICVDDGSRDNTLNNLYQAREQFGQHVRVVSLQRNFGQTAAMQAGIDASRGNLVATMDGDLQNDPSDIPHLLEELKSRDLDVVQGWRHQRKDAWLNRKLPSILANRLITKVTGVKLHDYGCSLKVYRASVLKQVRLFGEMHRFIPIWMATVTKPSRIGEAKVNHHARQFGESKYGLSRIFRVVLDLLAVFFFLKFKARPGHFFGYLGFWFGTISSLIMSYLAVVKFILGEDIGSRPLFFIAILLLVASLQSITTGVLAEMLSRVFFQATNAKGYITTEPELLDYNRGWQQPDTGMNKQEAAS